MTQTALWPFDSTDADTRDFALTDAHIAVIRKCAVYWEGAEHGAPGLADDSFFEIEDDDHTLYRALDIFFDLAQIDSFSGTVRNPYIAESEGLDDTLSDIPDATVAGLFQSGADFDCTPTDDELALWREANLGPRGIDCKRPFGTGLVSRDIRAVIDPDKKMKPAAFKKYACALEARMAVLLQFFVQTATIAPGLYRRGDGTGWAALDPADADTVEEIDKNEWLDRADLSFHYQTTDYVETGKAIWKLVWDDRLKGSYAELSAQLRLTDSYGPYSDARYAGATLEQVQEGLAQFPETSGVPIESPLARMALRMLNAHGQFSDAMDVFKTAQLTPRTAPAIDYKKPAWAVVLILEHLITRYGSGDMTRDAFEDALNGRCADYDYEPRASYNSSLYDLAYRLDLPDNLPLEWLTHLQAIAIQIKIMQGPYVPH